MATANDFAVANSYLPPKKPVLGQNELAVWVSGSIATPFGVEKLEWWGYPTAKKL